MRNPAPLLSPAVVAQIRRIAAAIRAREVAPLVGAGISSAAGLPGWSELVDRIISAWQRWDGSPAARRLSRENYIRLVRHTFQTDLAVISYIRRRILERGGPESFGQVLYAALYAGSRESFFVPQPNHLHRHLVALFRSHPRRIWTTNYDDLLEEAARLVEPTVRSIEPRHRLAAGDFAVAHVHGFLPPVERLPDTFRLEQAQVILAEDDYHAVATHVVDWTNRELYHLFDDHRVLILGMSLGDPNIRRVLASIEQDAIPDDTRHWAVMPVSDARQLRLHRVRQSSLAGLAEDMNALRSSYWRDHGVEIVDLPDYESLLPFLMRLRYESFGNAAGDLWKQGAERGSEAVRPWDPDRQRAAKLILDAGVQELRRDFGVTDGAEVVELGIFLLRPDGRTLELTFRGGTDVRAVRGARTFSVDPDRPEGVAGRVFVSGDLVRVSRHDPLHDYGLPEEASGASSQTYEGIISAPIIDWQADGVPLGVVYLTTSRTDGTLFKLPARAAAGQEEKSVEDLYEWLSDLAMLVLSPRR